MSNAARLTPERAFAAIGLLFGVLLLFIIPPFQVADEPAHFFRAYQLAEGELIPQRQQAHSGGFLPASLPAVATLTNTVQLESKAYFLGFFGGLGWDV